MASEAATPHQIRTIVLAGIHDPRTYLSLLRGTPHLIQFVYQLATNEHRWKTCIRLPDCQRDAEFFRRSEERGRKWYPLPSTEDERDDFLFQREDDHWSTEPDCEERRIAAAAGASRRLSRLRQSE